jgi:predicted phosphodiesterase
MPDNLTEKFYSLVSPGPNGSDTKATNTPESWKPRMELDENGGFLISTPQPAGQTPDSKNLLKEFDLDPNSWRVTSVRRSRWQKFDGEWLEAYRLTLSPASELENLNSDLDTEKLIDEIKKWKPPKYTKQETGELAYVFAPSDQQIGKKQGHEGTEQSIKRILETTEGGVHRLQELRKIGRKIGTIVLALPGDHVEGNVSQNGRLQGQAASDLGLTEQTRVARRLLMAQIKAFAPLCEKMIIPVVNGNHDEVTRQVAADPSDGWNVEIASAVQDACFENESLSHVEFRFPAKSTNTVAVNVSGTMLGIFHGHQAGRDVLKYLSGQAAGQTPIGGCDVWISGHYHNFKSMDIGYRFWVQAPTTDPGSAWFKEKTGLESHPGVLSMVIGADYDPRKDLSVIKTIR